MKTQISIKELKVDDWFWFGFGRKPHVFIVRSVELIKHRYILKFSPIAHPEKEYKLPLAGTTLVTIIEEG